MAELTVPVSGATHQVLLELAARTGEPVRAVVDRAVEIYRRQQFLEAVNSGYAALRSDPAAWQEELDERRDWDVTLGDGTEALQDSASYFQSRAVRKGSPPTSPCHHPRAG